MTPHPRRLTHLFLAVLAAVSLVAAACGDDDGATVREIGGDADGSTSGSSSGSASGSASTPASASGSGSSVAPGDELPAGDGGYDYASNVDAHRRVVADICGIGDLLDAGDFDAVATIYREGGNSVNRGSPCRFLSMRKITNLLCRPGRMSIRRPGGRSPRRRPGSGR